MRHCCLPVLTRARLKGGCGDGVLAVLLDRNPRLAGIADDPRVTVNAERRPLHLVILVAHRLEEPVLVGRPARQPAAARHDDSGFLYVHFATGTVNLLPVGKRSKRPKFYAV